MTSLWQSDGTPQGIDDWEATNLLHSQIAGTSRQLARIEQLEIRQFLAEEEVNWNNVINIYANQEGLYPLLRLADIYLHLGNEQSLQQTLDELADYESEDVRITESISDFIALKQVQRDFGILLTFKNQTSPSSITSLADSDKRSLAAVQAQSTNGLDEVKHIWPPIDFQPSEERLSVGDNDELGEILIYPNPNHGQFQFRLLADQEAMSVSIYDVIGQEVYYRDLSENKREMSIKLNHVVNGLYWVKVQTDEGEVVRTIIKMDANR